ncbi:hypothetical protein HBA54_16590 [Pelagibius litoralis]|uniref:Lysozyme inhibitor LprI N-terminal domain-containing protein n=1 Tax=Pelagibius litoralis TaxID=374515 RepID=A0A967EZC6_9PROT|nr:hypothetical protein [Pelagibius litoralis]NIA70226.1 hypothetical protein [Pelagibius litoralis]
MKTVTLGCAAWILLIAAAPATAGGNGRQALETFDPEPIINDCWEKSSDLRGAGSAAAYGDGLDITLACMEEAVLTEINAWLLPEFTENATAHMTAIENLHGKLYFRIYSHNRYCSRSCGLLPGMRYIESYIKFLETVLRDIAAEKSFRYR